MNRPPLRSLLNPMMVFLVLVVAGNLAVFAFWTAPRWSSRLGIVGGATSLNDIRNRVEPGLRSARGTYGRLARAESDLQSFRSRLVTEAESSELLGMLTEAGDDVGINLDDASLQFVSIAELGVQQLAITFPVTGTYVAVRSLLDELVALPVFLVIDGIDLQVPVRDASVDGNDPVRADVAVSVFLEDPELVAVEASATTPLNRRAITAARDAERLRTKAASGDLGEIAEALAEQLEALPALPVDPRSLIVNLDRLESSRASTEPARNLFAIVRPLPSAAEVVETPEPFVDPEPRLPVRLLGVLRIDGRWHASLTDDVDLFVAAAGDSLPNGVEILEVGADYAEVVFGGQRTRLSLEGIEP